MDAPRKTAAIEVEAWQGEGTAMLMRDGSVRDMEVMEMEWMEVLMPMEAARVTCTGHATEARPALHTTRTAPTARV